MTGQIAHSCGHTNSRLICGCDTPFQQQIREPGPIDWGAFTIGNRDNQPTADQQQQRRGRRRP